MGEQLESGSLSGAVSLASAIAALRGELLQAWAGAGDSRLRFKPSPVELTMQLSVTSDKKARTGVKWWVIEAGGELSRQAGATHTVKLTLDPVLVDENGAQVELLVSDLDEVAADQAGVVAGRVGLSDPE